MELNSIKPVSLNFMMIQSVKYSHNLIEKINKLLTFAMNYFPSVNFATLIDTSFSENTLSYHVLATIYIYIQRYFILTTIENSVQPQIGSILQLLVIHSRFQLFTSRRHLSEHLHIRPPNAISTDPRLLIISES